MSIKRTLTKAAEKITGRKCTRCLHNCKGRCCHPDGKMFMRCWNSITRPGFEKRPPRYLKDESQAPVSAAFSYNAVQLPDLPGEIKPEPLTPEQQYQLEKIKATLQDAEDMARESGLLTED